MKQKLFEALKTRFKDMGVQDSVLDGVAAKLAETVTTEDQIGTAVSGVTFETLTQAEIDRRVTEGTKTAVKNYEKKYNLKDGKSLEKDPSKDTLKDASKEDDVPAWAKELMQANTELREQLSAQKKDQDISTRRTQASELLKASKVDEKLHKKWLSRIDLEDEETSLEDQVKALEAEYIELKQEFINNSMDGDGGKGGGETTDADMEAFLNDKFPANSET